MARNDLTDSITKLFENINVTENISNEQLLDILNELRICESRDTLSELPPHLISLTVEQKNLFLERCSREINVHHQLAAEYQNKQLSYPKVILLNKTEALLLSTNQQAPTLPPIYHLPYDSVSVPERDYYYPLGEKSVDHAFITNTPSTYINTPTYSVTHKCFIATHNIPTQVHSKPIASTSRKHQDTESPIHWNWKHLTRKNPNLKPT